MAKSQAEGRRKSKSQKGPNGPENSKKSRGKIIGLQALKNGEQQMIQSRKAKEAGREQHEDRAKTA
ncbi:hypothetical protein F1912_13805 [Akkermansia muciniphila]|nr:hypothetical protein F1912_13805 [Akkermansia muciniphila]